MVCIEWFSSGVRWELFTVSQSVQAQSDWAVQNRNISLTITLDIEYTNNKSIFERFYAVSVAVPFCVFDDKDHNFTASFVIRFINGSTARTETPLTLSPP